MEKGRGKRTDTLQTDKVFTRKEYIEREAAIKARKRSCKRNCAECDFAIEGDSWCEGEVFAVDLLRIPAADVKPVIRGVWDYVDFAPWFIKCSQCGCVLSKDGVRDGKANFCPNCGARMDGDGDV